MNRATPMNIGEIYNRIFKGSMPRLYEASNLNRNDYFESYLETYISRDVKDLTGLSKPSKSRRVQPLKARLKTFPF